MKGFLNQLMMLLSLIGNLPANAQTSFRYNRLPDLPAANGKLNPGVAGAFAGVSHGALLVAGGANFPNGYPWQNGVKVWQSAIYVLTQPGESTYWRQIGHLNKPLAYGASVVWKEKLICLGGNDATQRYANVFALIWNSKTSQVYTEALPNLPQPLANLSAAVLGDELYVFGGESNQGPVKRLYVLNLLNFQNGWQPRADLPGAARAFMALVALSKPAGSSLLVLGGRQTIDNHTAVLRDAYQYNPKQDKWTRMPDMPVAVSAHEAIEVSKNRLVVFGGDDGVRLRQIEDLNNRIAQQSDSTEKGKLIEKRNDLQANHPGFRREIWQYQTDTRRWSVSGRVPFPAPVTTTAVRWEKSVVLPSGEVTPGVRTPTVRLITLVNP